MLAIFVSSELFCLSFQSFPDADANRRIRDIVFVSDFSLSLISTNVLRSALCN